MSRPAASVVLLGPVPPWRSGIADQTVRLARAMSRLGAPPLVITFSRMYPRALYPGAADRGEGAFPEDVEVVPLLADQELVTDRSTRVTYWEGACDVRAPGTGRSLGRAYVELTGYAGKGALGLF